jgi:hypothetical protein
VTVQDRISSHLASLPEAKARDLSALHQLALTVLPGGPLWFLDGTNDQGKVVANPNIGHGTFVKSYADGTARPFYKVGLCATSTGISVYLMTIDDRTYLPRIYGGRLGKAGVTGYCIKARSLKDLDLAVMETAMRDAAGRG